MGYWDEGVDDTAVLSIEFENGATASVSVYGDAPTVREAHHIWDEEGAAYVEGRGWGGRTFTSIDDEGTEHSALLDRSEERNKADAFLDAVKTGEEPPATATDSIRATAVVVAAYEAAETEERVQIELPEDAQ